MTYFWVGVAWVLVAMLFAWVWSRLPRGDD